MSRKKGERSRDMPNSNQEVMSRGVSLKRSAFLAAYGKTCSIMRVAEAAGIDRRTHYRDSRTPRTENNSSRPKT